MKPKFLLISLFFAIAQNLLAQQFNISGEVVDAQQNAPIEFASIALLKQDSSYVAGVNSLTDGKFSIDKIAQGNYLVAVSFLGYETSYTSIEALTKNTDLGSIRLQTSSVGLDDVVVTAQSVINKPDRKIILPTSKQIETSNNGFDLLQKLQLARLRFDPVNKTITLGSKEEVQLRINGALVTLQEIMALRPEDIIRIEYHDNPGMRYGGAGAVVDYIVRRRDSGGSLSTDLSHGISKLGYAEDHLSAKVNHKKSEFGVNAYHSYRQINWTRENDETFIFPDKMFHRTEEGEPTKFQRRNINVALNYSVAEQDKYFFNATLRNNNNNDPHSFEDRISTIYNTNNSSIISVSDLSSSKNNTPSLDLYFQRNLKKNQLLIFNVVGTYISSDTRRTYLEKRDGEITTDVFSKILGDKYSIITEGIYEKTLTSGKLSAGIKHSQSYTDNQYSGNIEAEVSLNLAETYFYSEYQFKKGKFNYMFGLGALRTYFSQGGNDFSRLFFRPTLRVNYAINDNAYVGLNSYMSGYAPSLADLNDVEQYIDSLQMQRGNPNLKSVPYISNTLNAGLNKGIISLELFIRHSYDHQPVMEEIYFEDGKFIHSIDNQKGFHRIQSNLDIKVRPLKDHITLTVSPGFNRYISLGNNYTHAHTNWLARVELEANYKNWLFSAQAFSRYNWFWGETLNRGERLHFISAGYKKPRWSVMVSTLNLFSKTYFTDSSNFSEIAPKRSEVRTDKLSKTILVTFSYNINFGRQYKANNKRLNNNDSDSGIMSGSKK